MQVKMRGKKVGVEKLKKSSSKGSSFIVMPESEEYIGIVRYIGDDAAKDLQVGQKVYFSNSFQTVRILGSDVCVMDDVNVLAVVEDAKEINNQV